MVADVPAEVADGPEVDLPAEPLTQLDLHRGDGEAVRNLLWLELDEQVDVSVVAEVATEDRPKGPKIPQPGALACTLAVVSTISSRPSPMASPVVLDDNHHHVPGVRIDQEVRGDGDDLPIDLTYEEPTVLGLGAVREPRPGVLANSTLHLLDVRLRVLCREVGELVDVGRPSGPDVHFEGVSISLPRRAPARNVLSASEMRAQVVAASNLPPGASLGRRASRRASAGRIPHRGRQRESLTEIRRSCRLGGCE